MHPKKESSRWWEKCSHTRHFKLWRSIHNYSLISICREGACAARETLCCNLSPPLSFSLSVFSPTKSLVSLFIRLDQYELLVVRSGRQTSHKFPTLFTHSFLRSLALPPTWVIFSALTYWGRLREERLKDPGKRREPEVGLELPNKAEMKTLNDNPIKFN